MAQAYARRNDPVSGRASGFTRWWHHAPPAPEVAESAVAVGATLGQSSRTTTLRAAAIGSAIRAPASPARLDPISNVMITVGADRSIAFVMTLGRIT